MSEQETILKKKKVEQKKKFDLNKAVEETMPLVINYRKYLGELVTKTYNIYMDCDNETEWETYCNALGFSRATIEGWHREHNLPSKKFLATHEFLEADTILATEDSNIQDNYINPEIEVDVEYQSNADQYKKVISAIKFPRILRVSDFNIPEREKLLDELKITYKKIGGLIMRLESGLDD
jgi:hypothetical protein